MENTFQLIENWKMILLIFSAILSVGMLYDFCLVKVTYKQQRLRRRNNLQRFDTDILYVERFQFGTSNL